MDSKSLISFENNFMVFFSAVSFKSRWHLEKIKIAPFWPAKFNFGFCFEELLWQEAEVPHHIPRKYIKPGFLL